jgi:membrane protein implicated in regulation of membrane protease activity
MDWSLAAYIFTIVVGVGLAFVSGFLSDIIGGGDHDIGVDHDVSIDHDISVDHDVSVDHDIGADHDISVDHDVGGVTEVGAHPSPISAPVLSTFMVVFGFSGMIGEKVFRLPTIIAAPGAAGVSVLLAALVFLALCKLFMATQGTSHGALRDLIGLEAEVITPIPAEGVGEIAYITATGRASLPARSESATLIPKHSMVTVTQMTGNVALVRETVDEELRKLSHEQETESEQVNDA